YGGRREPNAGHLGTRQAGFDRQLRPAAGGDGARGGVLVVGYGWEALSRSVRRIWRGDFGALSCGPHRGGDGAGEEALARREHVLHRAADRAGGAVEPLRVRGAGFFLSWWCGREGSGDQAGAAPRHEGRRETLEDRQPDQEFSWPDAGDDRGGGK